MLGFFLLMLFGLAVAYAGVVVYIAWALTHPSRRTYASAVSRGLAGDPSEMTPSRAFEAWSLTSRNRELPVWDLPGDEPEGPVVILTHGWSDSRIGGLVRVPALVPHASRVVLWDQPGHGDAPGACDLGARTHRDLLALLGAIDDGGRGVVLYGWSMGAGVSIAAAIASPERVVGVIAESPYRVPTTPARSVLVMRGVPHRMTLRPALALAGLFVGAGMRWRGFDRARLASELAGTPLVALHGDGDVICQLVDSRAIIDAAPRGSLEIIVGGGHNNLWTDPTLRACSAAAVDRAFGRVVGRVSASGDSAADAITPRI